MRIIIMKSRGLYSIFIAKMTYDTVSMVQGRFFMLVVECMRVFVSGRSDRLPAFEIHGSALPVNARQKNLCEMVFSRA